MHIPDGVLSPEVLAIGAAVAAGGVAVGLATMDHDRIPRVAVLASAFFVASLPAVPIGPASVHVLLVGLMGVVLGWSAFPAIAIALFLQALLFGHGGLTSLGVNTANMAVPAVVCYYLFGGPIRRSRTARRASVLGFCAGGLAIAIGIVMLVTALVASGKEFATFAALLSVAYLALAGVEAAITGSVVAFLYRVNPQVLGPQASRGAS